MKYYSSMKHYPFYDLISILILISFLGCSEKEEKQPKIHINYLKAYDIPVNEPSGLDLTFTEKGFWTVSDENSTVYKLDNWGKIEKSFIVKGVDLEGISIVDKKTLAIVLERRREIIIMDTSGTELKRVNVNLSGELNNGLEGITYDPENKKYFVLNEKNPSLLLTFDENLNELRRDTLNFIKDASGIHFDGRNKLLWILSDESQLVAKCDFRGTPLKIYYISIVQPEGITIDEEGRKMYIVSDRNNALYVYDLK